MKLKESQIDWLDVLKETDNKKFDRKTTENIIEVLKEVEASNLYTKNEVDNMIAQVIKDVLDKFDESNEKFEASRKESDEKFEKIRADMRSDRHWVVGTIIATGLTATGLLATLIHFSH